MITIEVAQPARESSWNGFVERHPGATGYHLWGWRRVFERAFGHPCVYLAAVNDGTVVGILPLVIFENVVFGRFAVSLPFVNYGGVVADDETVARQLLEAAAGMARTRRLEHVELRHLAAQFPDLPAKRHKVAMLLPLPPSTDTLWQAIDRKVRNQVRKAEKSGLTSVTGGADLVPEFYEVFARNMRDLGTPVYSRRFFEAILEEFPQAARTFVVRLGTTPVAASLTVQWRRTTEVPWASSLREHRALCPNMLLYWSMLQAAVAAGSTTFDFGRSTPDEGTFHFKSQWGATGTPFAWEYWMADQAPLPNLSPANPKFQLAIDSWKRLPLWLTARLGPPIVRWIP